MKKISFNLYFFILNFLILSTAISVYPSSAFLFLQFVSLAFWLMLYLISDLLLPMGRLKTFISSAFLLLHSYAILDCFSLYYSSFPFFHVIDIALLGGDLFSTLREVGVTPLIGIILVVAPLSLLAAIIWLYRKTAQHIFLISKRSQLSLILFSLISMAAIIMEQVFHHNDPAYWQRQTHLPLYLQIYSPAWEKFNFSTSPSQNELEQIVQNAVNPKPSQNILLIILEGVRGDAMDPQTMPFLTSWSKKAQSFPFARTEAISTHLALNSLLFNRPPYSFESDIENSKKIMSAALPFEIYKKNKYEIYLGISTDFSMKSNESRALGKNQTVDHYFKAFDADYVGRQITDNRVAEKSKEWLRNQKTDQPFLMTLQFDCTHWPYEFSEESAVFNPYLKTDRLDKFDSIEGTQLVINRYKNSLRHLDRNLEKVLSTLEQTGFAKNTAVVIISDHGENFRKGLVTHLNLSTESKKIFNLIYLPNQKIPSITGFISHRDIWPTLFDFTDIRFTLNSNSFSGTSLLSPTAGRHAILTVSGNLKLAQLTYATKVIHFNSKVEGQNLFLSPYLVSDENDRPLADWQNELSKIDWVSDVRSSLF